MPAKRRWFTRDVGVGDIVTIDRLLEAGWEPFAVDNSIMYLRKKD